MSPEKLLQKLLEEARQGGPSDRVPYAFESRIMHAVRNQPPPDSAIVWARGLWQAVLPCMMIAAVSITASVTLFRTPEVDVSSAPTISDQAETVDLTASSPADMNETPGDAAW